jgi:eukaryotic-like serine/threonine-protein kinase
MVMATPAYMAAEQHTGGTVDARTDQFSFCVALYEALYGERPFCRDSPDQLSADVLSGEIRSATQGVGAPSWLRDAVLKGMCVDPSDRHPTMEALLRVLARRPRATGGRVALALAVIAISAGGVSCGQRSARPERMCQAAEPLIAARWDAAQKQAVHQAFAATKLPYAEDTWRTVERTLDSYSNRWATTHTEACEATHVTGTQSGELLDLRMSCLEERRLELDALVNVFRTADRSVVEKAVAATTALTPVEQLPSDPIVRPK